MRKREEEESKKFFVGPDGKHFDPLKKFGGLDSEGTLIYDKITTSYELNLPSDYYLKAIRRFLPSDDKDNDKWFIKPHHIESVTGHKSSIRDDFLNTRYYSHYNRDYGKSFEPTPNE